MCFPFQYSDTQNTNNALVCSSHFENADIPKHLQDKKLLAGAVPQKIPLTKTLAKRNGTVQTIVSYLRYENA